MHPIVLILTLFNVLFFYLVYNDLAQIYHLMQFSYLEVLSMYLFAVMSYFLLVSPYADIKTLLEINPKDKVYFYIAKTGTIMVFALFYYLVKVFIK